MNKVILYVKIIINFLIVIAVALSALLLLPKILGFFIPFVIGWIVALIANPLVRFLERKLKILRKHSSAIIIIVVIAAIVGVAYLLLSFLIKQVLDLMNDLPAIIDYVGKQFMDISLIIKKYTRGLPSGIQDKFDGLISGVSDYVTEYVANMKPLSMSTAGNLARNVADIFLNIIITVLSAYFFTVRKDEFMLKLKRNLPESVTSYWHLIYDNFKAAFGGYFKAQFKIMLVLTVIMFIGFEILGIGYSFLFALGIAFLDLLPVFGTGAVLWPWALVEVLTGNYMRAVGLVIIYLVCQVVKQLLQPKMVGDSIGLNPLATLLFMYIGYKFSGVIGMIIGIPIGMVLVNMFRIGMFDRIIRGFKIIVHDINEFRKF